MGMEADYNWDVRNNMSLLDEIKADLKQAMMSKDEARKSTLRMVIGEVPRLNKKAGEKPTDEEVLDIIRKLIKSETMVLNASGQDESKSDYINILKDYLPSMMTEHEIAEWIERNININDYSPKIKAMGEIMKALRGKADGNVVRKLLS